MINYGYGVGLVSDISEKARHWRNTMEMRKWVRETDEISYHRHKNWLEAIDRQGQVRMYGIVTPDATDTHPASRSHIGVCGLTNMTYTHGSAEWSLYISPDVQKKGFATAALRTLIRHGFESLRLNRIWGEIFAHNAPSVKLAEKCGMKLEGRLRETYWKEGHFIDTVIYSILAKEWKP